MQIKINTNMFNIRPTKKKKDKAAQIADITYSKINNEIAKSNITETISKKFGVIKDIFKSA